ncbi:phage antirepressor [uncultured Tessaracoccus sp.]|uniref:phage antirepressor n=1 Tax=uncultured Tessaracoccus sp. TaxID=905023 RepID=UPI00260277E2|nr:phage antirepressor [uncultured Tessaracoccus sp.]
MSDLIPFQYEGSAVRTLLIDREPWFVLADLCKALDLAKPSRVAMRIADDMKGAHLVSTPGGQQEMTIVSEAGMYEVVIRSDKPEAATFRRWITTEVLPSIRKTGQYGTASALEAQIPKTLPDALRAYAREVEAREAMEAYARELEPKADNYDRFMSADGTYSVGAVAKMLGPSQNKLFAELRNVGVLIAKGAMANTPYQQYMHHFAVKAYEYTRSDGTVGSSYTTRVQPSGVDFIARKLGRYVQEVAA